MTSDTGDGPKTTRSGAAKQPWEPMRVTYLGDVADLIQGGGGGDGKMSNAAPSDDNTGKKTEGGG